MKEIVNKSKNNKLIEFFLPKFDRYHFHIITFLVTIVYINFIILSILYKSYSGLFFYITFFGAIIIISLIYMDFKLLSNYKNQLPPKSKIVYSMNILYIIFSFMILFATFAMEDSLIKVFLTIYFLCRFAALLGLSFPTYKKGNIDYLFDDKEIQLKNIVIISILIIVFYLISPLFLSKVAIFNVQFVYFISIIIIDILKRFNP